MYASCMDLQAREERGLIPLESILMRTGGWPMIMDREEWYDEDASWQEIEKNYFYINGKFVFYDIDAPYLRKLYGEEFIERIDLAPGSLPFAKEFPHKWYLGRDEMMEEYAKVIEKVAIEFIKHNKAAVTEEMLRKDIDDLLEFDRQIQKLLRSDHDDAEISVGEFLELYNGNVTDIPDEDKIDFGNHMKILFGMENIKINRTVQMLIQSPTYYSNITLLLKETPIRTIANYIHWNFVSNMLPHATKKLQDIYDNMVAKKPGAVKRKPSWMECVQMIKMDQASSYAFVMKYFSDETEKAAVEMTENVRNEMEWQIDNSDWLDDLGKKFTKDKLRSMKFFIGFPSWYKNRTAVMNSYKGLKIGYDYFENILNFEKYSVREHLRYLKNVKQDEHWGMEPVMVNALYAGPQNYLNIPAADLQPPFFTPDFPE
uniref:MMEL1_4 protein n=1 Tax=Fopius arisanus TaxID=64838 RepID=A0A0C9RX37_9HYME